MGDPQPMAEEDELRRKGCAKGAIGKRPGRPRREGCAGLVLGERDLLDLVILRKITRIYHKKTPSDGPSALCD